jgi:hypothetical protein
MGRRRVVRSVECATNQTRWAVWPLSRPPPLGRGHRTGRPQPLELGRELRGFPDRQASRRVRQQTMRNAGGRSADALARMHT